MKTPMKQVAALPFVNTQSGPLVLLITTRAMGRWTIPKGWAKPDMTNAEMAAREAFEEAGARATSRPSRSVPTTTPSGCICSPGPAAMSTCSGSRCGARGWIGRKSRAGSCDGWRRIRPQAWSGRHNLRTCSGFLPASSAPEGDDFQARR
ncbi:NUDIX domain-containing protein [Methyloceanibacter superfactus]|uniref:NUDIX domain-containing protein n=1 Tax=Methyloceanibacter superfactus TaxID=1774969 RepID=UPI003CC7A9D3